MLKFITSQNFIISTCVALLIINMNIILNFESVWCTFDMQKRLLKKHCPLSMLNPFHLEWNFDLHENFLVFFFVNNETQCKK